MQTCVEGIADVDAHIGAEKLHNKCYATVAPLWELWSYGYKIPQERTKMRAAGKFAEISGSENAIWSYFYKKKGNAKEPRFDPRNELDIYITITDDDYEQGELQRRTGQSNDTFEDGYRVRHAIDYDRQKVEDRSSIQVVAPTLSHIVRYSVHLSNSLLLS
jgi:hypothetical protein